MKIIQLHLPDDLAGKVSQLFPNTESFIIETLRTKASNGFFMVFDFKFHIKHRKNNIKSTNFCGNK